MQARDLMTGSPLAVVTPELTLAEAARRLVEADCGALPVVDGATTGYRGRPVGMITDRDIVCRSLALGKDPLRMTVEDCMSAPCVTVTDTTSVGECCDTMEANQIRRLVVVDEEGQCCGIISQADVARGLPERMAAEVLREISLPGAEARATF